MTPQRFSSVFNSALSAKKRLSRYRSIRRNDLPLISFNEDKWLRENGHSAMLPFTRTFRYRDDEYKEDTNRPSSAQKPAIREVWVGARSLACIGEDDNPEGLSNSQLEQEDAAELTELQTLLYHDAATGQCMIMDDDTGEYRPIRNGDVIQVVRGSNDNLDSLFLEEPADERSEHDSMIREQTRDQIRANTELEQSFLNDPSYRIPNSALPEGMRWQPDEITLWRLAHRMAERVTELLTERKEKVPSFRQLADEAYARLQSMSKDLSFDNEGVMIQGYFVSKAEYFGTLDQNMLRHQSLKKARPAPINWSAVRKAQSRTLATA